MAEAGLGREFKYHATVVTERRRGWGPSLDKFRSIVIQRQVGDLKVDRASDAQSKLSSVWSVRWNVRRLDGRRESLPCKFIEKSL